VSARVLYAWLEGRPVGVFAQSADGTVEFSYDEDAPPTPVSLSLPREGGWPRSAPYRFLDNLLPDDHRARRRMAYDACAESDSVMDLLAVLGGDVAGGLVLASTDEYPARPDAPLIPMSDDDIAHRIATLRAEPDRWLDRELSGGRFSLAGAQAKFAMTRRDGGWYLPSAAAPSTHIIKPSTGEFPDVDVVEAATMRLAGLAGMPAPRAGLVTVLGQQAYMVERFDRDGSTRLHTEDLAQALGIAPDEKYAVTAPRAVAVLHRVDPSDELAYAFVRALALHVAVGDADAHAKNYSVFLRPGAVSLTPVYDALTTLYWASLSLRLAMPVAGAVRSEDVTPDDWAELARECGLAPDRVVTIAQDTSRAVLAAADQAYEGVPGPVHERLTSALARANTGMRWFAG